MLNIYVLQNKLTGTFKLPIIVADDWTSFKRYQHDLIICKPDKAREFEYDTGMIWYMGKYDDLTGKFEIFDVPEYYDLAEGFNQLDALKRSLGNE